MPLDLAVNESLSSNCKGVCQPFIMKDQPIDGRLKAEIQISRQCASAGDLKRWARESIISLGARRFVPKT